MRLLQGKVSSRLARREHAGRVRDRGGIIVAMTGGRNPGVGGATITAVELRRTWTPQEDARSHRRSERADLGAAGWNLRTVRHDESQRGGARAECGCSGGRILTNTQPA